jgi:hypothetical protein
MFKGDNNPQHDFLPREVKPSSPCRKFLRHVKNPLQYERDTSEAIFTDISLQVHDTLLLRVCVGYSQRALVGESEIIKTQRGKDNRSLIVSLYGTPCAIPSPKQ